MDSRAWMPPRHLGPNRTTARRADRLVDVTERLARCLSYKNQGSVTVEFDGKSYNGDWELDGSLLEVTSFECGSNSTQLGNMQPETLAKMLLRELLQESRAKKLV